MTEIEPLTSDLKFTQKALDAAMTAVENLRGENEDLRAENEKLKADLREMKDANLGLNWAIGEINGENDDLRKDAIRHRWLREHQFDIGSFYDVSEYNHKAWFEHIDDESIDRCISEDTEFAAENGQ
jgi:hypothetical protein